MTNLLRPSPTLRSLLATAAIAAPIALLLAPASALAAGSLEVKAGVPQSLGGDAEFYYNTVTIRDGGKLSVIPYGTPGGTGTLRIKANKIVIESGGVLDATGAGYRGMSNAQGGGPGGGGFLAMAAGGGGAYFGNGGAATNALCAGGFGAGGVKYGDVNTALIGSAGGSGGTTPGPIGGSGGGSIILDAAQISINGDILANGANGNSLGGVGSGGGAGGEIRLQASTFIWGPKARLMAVGGNGAKATNSSGGSGGGGLIWIRGTPLPDTSTGIILDANGGIEAEAACAAAAGQAGVIDQSDMFFDCRDLDTDGEAASLCGGTDCDDADALVNTKVDDKCDGINNDCKGAIDDSPTACAAGLQCVDAMCQSTTTLPDGGTGDGGPSGTAPETVEYRGGCAVTSGQTESFYARGLLLSLLVSLGVRRARRSRGRG